MSGVTRCACVAMREGLSKPGEIFEVCDGCTSFGYPSYVAKIKEQRVLFKKLHPDATIPKKQREGDAAFDLYWFHSAYEEKCLLAKSTFFTGVACAIPDGYVGIIKERSGLALEYGVNVLGGVIDSNYRGEIKVILEAATPTRFKRGDRIAQLLVVPIHTLGWEEVDELPENLYRGDKAFGSSGV